MPSVLTNYKPREVQIKVANIINKAFDQYENVVIEAPTGSGKTMAYLVPAFSSENKVIISTKTKQLMNQLLYKDIPMVKQVLGRNKEVSSLKGRSNYFCLQRFFRLIYPKSLYYPDAVNWYEENSRFGIIIEAPWGIIDKEVCSLMTADRYQCNSSKCAFYDECGFYFQKKEANKSSVLVTNHFMLLSDIAMKSKEQYGSIFDFKEHIIFDEAHSIPDIFTQYAGVDLSLSSLMILFYENKDIIPLSSIDLIHKEYSKIVYSMTKDDKYLYEKYQKEICHLFDTALDIIKSIDNEDINDEFNKYLSLFKEIEKQEEGLYIIEKATRKNNVSLNLKYVPFKSGEKFIKGLKEAALSSVFISATLSSKDDFQYYLSEIGIEDNCTTYTMPNVFDFTKQGILFIPENDSDQYKDMIYKAFAEYTSGSILIICNSIERMIYIEKYLRSLDISNKIIYSQSSVNIGELDFTTEDMILIGSAAMREGIDIAGGSFKAVILDKLPFEYPKDLLLDSKAQRIANEGKNPFMDFFLPRAVLYFKQAVGRLIRHEDDYGVWACLDGRLVTSKYKQYFLKVFGNIEILTDINDVLQYLKGD